MTVLIASWIWSLHACLMSGVSHQRHFVSEQRGNLESTSSISPFPSTPRQHWVKTSDIWPGSPLPQEVCTRPGNTNGFLLPGSAFVPQNGASSPFSGRSVTNWYVSARPHKTLRLITAALMASSGAASGKAAVLPNWLFEIVDPY